MTRKKSSQVLVITDSVDAHVPFVQKHTDVPLIIIDQQKLLDGIDTTFTFEHGRTIITYDNIELSSVVAVWYRKPTNYSREQLHMPEKLKPYAITCMSKHMAQFLSAFQSAQWVNDYFALMRAESKALQLELADRAGLRVPDTILTSNPEAAKRFIAKHKSCVVKAQSAFSPSADGLAQAFLTTKLDPDNLPDFSNLHLAPAIFQQAVEPLYDVRVTVIGDQVFAAKIANHTLDKTSAVLDWRIGYHEGDMQIEAIDDFPDEIAQKCRAFVKSGGLLFSALDFVMDRRGKLWFLENNPNGQWGFVEEATGQPMGKAMARLLTTGPK